MDNKGGGAQGTSGETEKFFGAVETGENFDAFMGSREDLKPKMETPPELIDNDNTAEVAGEEQPTEQPAVAATNDDSADDEKKDEEVKEQLAKLKVSGNAGMLPSAYEKAVRSIMARNRKDPFRLVRELDIARWDLMEKAFSRKLGDGLNGSGTK